MLKHKNDEPTHNATSCTGMLVFLAIWTMGYATAWWLPVTILKLLENDPIFNTLFYPLYTLLLSFFPGILLTIIQLLAVERILRMQIQGWLWVNFVAWVIGTLVLYGYYTSDRVIYLPIPVLLPFLPVMLIQWLWFRQRVYRAWIWIVASIVGAIFFVLVFMIPALFYIFENEFHGRFFALAGAAHGIVPGIAMYWLLQHPRRKAKPE